MPFPLLVRRVDEHEVVAASAIAIVAQRRDDVAIRDDRPGEPQLLEIRLDHARRRAIALDEDAARRAARQRLEPHRARPGEEIEHRRTLDGPDRSRTTASRTRSPVGRVTTPFGAAIRWPLREPATILTTRPGARPRRAGGRRRRRAGPRPGALAPLARSLEEILVAAEPDEAEIRVARTGARRGAGPRRGSRGRARRARSRRSSRPSPRGARSRSRRARRAARETSRQYDCSAPRPTRPRS